jgi:deazaflavin-dependent oxidoreductase (nitroreductase family)
VGNSWQWFGALHTRAYRMTGGRLGANLIGLPVLLLTTVGRRSGEARTTPMPYYAWQSDYVIVGSNNGLPRDPAWWLNLQSRPEAEVQLRSETIAVRARLATLEERAALWPHLVEFNPRYRVYAERTTREIPVVVLSPDTAT